ncbi:MAG: ADP-ribosylglycohydrolase family protein [Acetobacterium sp.]
MKTKQKYFSGCLFGGAIGDALGYTVEFMRLPDITDRFGESGITDLVLSKESNIALISDDTQMTLFTADGMVWAYLDCGEESSGACAVSRTYQSYLRWLYTQTGNIKDKHWLEKQPHEKENNLIKYDKSILEYCALFAQRAPGNSCLTALASGKMGNIADPVNNSKGCGGVMRVAPVGLFFHNDPVYAFRIGAEIAAITHGHPTGYLSAGTFATIIAELINGKTIVQSVKTALRILKTYQSNEETLAALEHAIELASGDENASEAIKNLGEGWVGEEALAIALYCALKKSDVKEALVLSVNHDGDSDSTGAICGNILGAVYGINALPEAWIANIELKELLTDMSHKLFELSEYAFSRKE